LRVLRDRTLDGVCRSFEILNVPIPTREALTFRGRKKGLVPTGLGFLNFPGRIGVKRELNLFKGGWRNLVSRGENFVGKN